MLQATVFLRSVCVFGPETRRGGVLSASRIGPQTPRNPFFYFKCQGVFNHNTWSHVELRVGDRALRLRVSERAAGHRACENRNTIIMLLPLTWNPHVFWFLSLFVLSLLWLELKVYIVVVLRDFHELKVHEVRPVACTEPKLHGLHPPERREVWKFTPSLQKQHEHVQTQCSVTLQLQMMLDLLVSEPAEASQVQEVFPLSVDAP